MTTAPRSSPARLGALPESTLPLIVHADDFGETAAITDGICQAMRAGVVTSTSVLANMPGTKYALLCAREFGGQVSFGVHLNLCEGMPLTAGATLVGEDGRFPRKRALFARAMAGSLSLRELEAEIAAQVGLVRDAGVPISHVDGHKHLHQLPVVSTAVAHVLPSFGIERVRITRLRSLRSLDKPSVFVRELIAWQAGRVFARAKLRSPARTIDLRALLANRLPQRRTQRLVDSAGAVELCCHPGTPAADREKPGSHRRSEELEYLLSPGFRVLLAASRARLVSYWQV